MPTTAGASCHAQLERQEWLEDTRVEQLVWNGAQRGRKRLVLKFSVVIGCHPHSLARPNFWGRRHGGH
eukprot:scaffold86329_cov75-Phaeocystis_antarctica.AAC.1